MKYRSKKEILHRHALRKHILSLRRKRRKRSGVAGSFGTIPKVPSRVIRTIAGQITGKMVGGVDYASGLWKLKIPKVFSIIENPEESLDVIFTLSSISRKPGIAGVTFDHSECEKMDLCASALLDVVTLALNLEWKSRSKKAKLEGVYPVNTRIRKLLQCTGLLSNLGFPARKQDVESFIRMPLIAGRKKIERLYRGGSDHVTAVQRLIEYLDNCFNVAGYTLNVSGQQMVSEWAGEIISNAEEHSGEDAWWVIAYMDLSAEGVDGECQFVVFSFGKSIYQTMYESDPNTTQMKAIKSLVEQHSKRNFFRIFGIRSYNESDLWTLYALQEGVSRFKGFEGGVDRGTGTVAMIETFQSLGCSLDSSMQPKMTILSGTTQIVFDGKYSLKAVPTREGQLQQIIAFNEQNDLGTAPDIENVHSIRNHFPGTLIAFKFFIDKNNLDAKSGYNVEK